MTVTVNCPCGAYIAIENASELATTAILESWFAAHRCDGFLPARETLTPEPAGEWRKSEDQTWQKPEDKAI